MRDNTWRDGRDMGRHIIVSGDNALATTIIEELHKVGANFVKLAGHNLAEAGLELADAVVCAGDDDARNLEIALLARKTNPNVRVVARLGNNVLREAVAADNGAGAILDVADLAAPSVVEACLADTRTHSRRPASNSSSRGPRHPATRPCAKSTATWHRWRSSTARTPHPRRGGRLSGTRSAGPRRRLDRDDRQRRRNWPLAASRSASGSATRARRLGGCDECDTARAMRNDVNPMFFRSLVASLLLLLGSTVLVRYSYGAAADDVARRPVFHHRDDRDRRLRRIQVRRSSPRGCDCSPSC